MPASTSAARRLAAGVDAGAFAVLLLLAMGWAIAPTVVPVAPIVVLGAYVIVPHVGLRVTEADGSLIQWVTLASGASAAAVLIWSDVVQYAGWTANNAIVTIVVLILLGAAGVAAAAASGRIRDAALSSALSAE